MPAFILRISEDFNYKHSSMKFVIAATMFVSFARHNTAKHLQMCATLLDKHEVKALNACLNEIVTRTLGLPFSTFNRLRGIQFSMRFSKKVVLDRFFRSVPHSKTFAQNVLNY